MSQFITEDDRRLLAGEYVLGTLDADERARANELLGFDQQFRDLVSAWERRLGELHLMVEALEPEPEIWSRIKGRLDGASPELGEGGIGTAHAETVGAGFKPTPTVPVADAVVGTGFKPAPMAPVADAGPMAMSDSEAAAERENASDWAPENRSEAQAAAVELATESDLAEPRSEPAGADAKPHETAPQPADSVGTGFKLAPTRSVGAEPQETAPAPADSVGADVIAAPTEAVAAEPVAAEAASEQPLPDPVASKEAPRPLTMRIFPEPVAEPEVRERKLVSGSSAGPWRALAGLMTLVAVALLGLIAAWRYVPDRLPPQLRASVLLNAAQPPASAPAPKTAPRAVSQFQE
jgi:hypothetical protein